MKLVGELFERAED